MTANDLLLRLRRIGPKNSGYAEIANEAADEIRSLRERIESLRSRIAELEQENAALRKDAERLDYLDSRVEEARCGGVFYSPRLQLTEQTLRQTIDAALAEQAAGEKK